MIFIVLDNRRLKGLLFAFGNYLQILQRYETRSVMGRWLKSKQDVIWAILKTSMGNVRLQSILFGVTFHNVDHRLELKYFDIFILTHI